MPEEYGPFESEREALATRAAALVRAAFCAAPGVGASVPECLKLMTDECEAAGVELGARDLSFLQGVAWQETAGCISLRGMVHRAHLAGLAAGRCPEGTVIEWGVRRPAADGETVVINCGIGGETMARDLLTDHRRVYGESAVLVSRQIGPWTLVAGKDGDNDA